MNRRRSPSGFTLLEVSIAIVILAAMAGLIAQSVLWRSAQQRSLRWREMAVIEAGNMMDRATSLGESELTQENLDAITLSESMQGRTPAATRTWTLAPAADEPTAQQMTLEIQLPGPGRAAGRAVRLTSWRFAKSPDNRQNPAPQNPAPQNPDSGQP